VRDIRIFPNQLAELLNDEQQVVGKHLYKLGISSERTAKVLVPVRTGRLRSSITTALRKDSRGLYAEIGSNVHYARWVEEGTRHQRPQPYLRPAVDEVLRNER
jgi:HK97 gp10 family phage protein